MLLYIAVVGPLGLIIVIVFKWKRGLYALGHVGVQLALSLAGIRYWPECIVAGRQGNGAFLVDVNDALRFVADSNVDWGQGLPQLKHYMDVNGIGAVYLSYFGTDRPEAHGIRFQPLPTYGRVGEPGGEQIPTSAPKHVLVVSANNLRIEGC